MSNDLPRFVIRLVDGEFVIDALWPDGSLEQLVGVFTSEEGAERWISENASMYVAQKTDSDKKPSIFLIDPD